MIDKKEFQKYVKLHSAHGDTLGSLGYSSKVTQRMRLVAVMNILENHRIRGVTDIGCGHAALLDMMIERGFYENEAEAEMLYCGIDIVQPFIEKCSKKYPGVGFFCDDYEEVIKKTSPKTRDAVVAIGIHSAKSDDAYEKFLYNVNRMYKYCGRLVVVTIMTDNKWEIREDEFVVPLTKVVEDLSQIEEKIIVDRSTCPYEATIALVGRIE